MPFHVRLPFAPRTFRFPVRPTRAKVGARPPMAAPRGGIADDTPPDGPHDRPPHAATDAGGPPAPGAAPSLGARRAAEMGWPVSQWCYRETLEPHGWLTEDQVTRKRGELLEMASRKGTSVAT